HRDTARAVALVPDLLVRHALKVAGPALRRALDRVARHVRAEALVDGGAEPRVRRRVTAAEARGRRDLADQLREQLPALRVLRVLAVLDVRPFRMAGHQNVN